MNTVRAHLGELRRAPSRGSHEVGREAERVAEARLAEAEDVAHRQPEHVDGALVEERRVALAASRAPLTRDVAVGERHALGVAARCRSCRASRRADRAIEGVEARSKSVGLGGVARGAARSARPRDRRSTRRTRGALAGGSEHATASAASSSVPRRDVRGA